MSATRTNQIPTRREYLTGSATAIGALAGCATDPAPSTTRTTATSTRPADATTTDDAYTVTLEPAGDVTFDAPPTTWVAENASWADMGVALGLTPPSAVVLTSEYRTWHYDDVPGVSVNPDEITSLWQGDGISKELFYDIGAGVHFIDPNYMLHLIPNWERADVEQITTDVAPFCGNTSFMPYPWHDDYPYYDLYDAFEKVAQVFRRTDRYEAFATLHDETMTRLRSRLPPERDRPAVALLSPASTEPEKFYPYRIGDTYAFKQWHDLGVTDALDGSGIQTFTANRGTIDYEPLLDVDPDVMLFYTDTHRSRADFRDTYLSFLRDHATASQLTAVQNGDVHPIGGMYQGPLANLAKTERAAKQLYPDEFERDEQLYDRQRVADIVAGNTE